MQKDYQNQPGGEILLYQTEDGRTRIECRFENETLWLSQALMAQLFQVAVPTVNEHLKGIYADGELHPEATIRKFRMVRSEGSRQVSREIEHYNLETILAVGFRDHIAANLSIELDDFELSPFNQEGGLGKVHQLFGDKLNAIIEELNETLVA
jgi:hypothetical protein